MAESPEPAEMVTVVNTVQSRNALLPIDCTDAGTVKEVSAAHPLNVFSPMDWTPSGIVTDWSTLHPLNVPIIESAAGFASNVTDWSEVHLLNVLFKDSRAISPFSPLKVTSVSDVQLLKDDPRDVTLLGMTSDVHFESANASSPIDTRCEAPSAPANSISPRPLMLNA